MFQTVQIPQRPGQGHGGSKGAYFILIYGEPLGQIFKIDKEQNIVGRNEETDFFIDDPAMSRKHAAVIYKNNTVTIKDLNSTNGTFVNEMKIEETVLENGDRVRIGRTYLKFSYIDELEEGFYRDFFSLATRDGLTNTINKTYIVELFERELMRTVRYKRPLSIMMLDIDHFKKVNDTYGHLAGDYILREVASAIAENLRGEDLFGRYGGEEFLMILPDINRKKAKVVAEKIRSMLENTKFYYEEQVIPVTVSIGVTEYTKLVHTPGELISIADKNLYIAKTQGRNRICDG